ncbi:hypothetical protein ACFWYW_28335 [Nonomuraea sp. NPDC059023]|uniref:hypothetical protein n=1 Tax=unclassified Nonomuraea TaxID=2593643 RepID=UPI0036A19474
MKHPSQAERDASIVVEVITKRLFPLAAVLAGSLLVPGPALAENVSGQVDPLRAALLVPEDLGSEFARRDYTTKGLLNPAFTRTKACRKAVKSLTAVYRTKVSTALEHTDRWEGISEYLVSGTPRKISALERAAKAMVRSCRKITVKTQGTQEIIRRLSLGRLGDSVYAVKFRSGFPDSDLERDAELATEMMVAIDIALIRVGNTMIVLEHDGHVGAFDPPLTRSAAQTAVMRLQEALPGD